MSGINVSSWWTIALGMAIAWLPVTSQALTVHVVTTVDDVVSADGLLSLREAFALANTDGDDSVIELGTSLSYVLDLCGMMPAHTSNAAGSLVHTATASLTVNGNDSTIQQTCPDERVMRNSSENATITLNDVTLTGGQVTEMATGDDGADIGGGGGLLSFGAAVLSNVILTGNTALQTGGGLRTLGETTISGGAITNNATAFGGGGADIGGGFSNMVPHLTMVGTLVEMNDGSGVFLRFGTNTITDSIIAENTGSGIFSDHGIHGLDNSDLIDNGGSGMVSIDGRITMTNSTASGNTNEGVITTGSGVLLVTDSTIVDNGTEGLEFSGCNGTEGNDNVIVTGSTMSGNGTFGINHAGCGYTIVTTSNVTNNGGGVRCSTCEGVSIEFSTIDGNATMGGVHFRPGWEGAGGTLVVRATDITNNNTSDDDGGGIRALEGFDDVLTAVTVSESSTIANNQAGGRGGGIYVEGFAFLFQTAVTNNHALGSFADPAGEGGGVYVTMGDLSINSSTIQNNTAQGDGGGVCHNAFSGNQLSLFHADVLDNDAFGSGGGVLADFSSLVVVSRSEISGNTSTAPGAGFAGRDTAAAFYATTLSDNEASAVGGGIYYRDSVLPGNPLIINYSTLSDNTAPDGGGIFADIRSPAGVELTNSTVSGNGVTGVRTSLTTPVILDSATVIQNELHNVHTASGLLTTTQSVIASADGGSDCMVPIATSLGYNFSGDGTCGLGLGAGDVSFGGDPGLGPLSDNGGPTLTHEPESGSPLLSMVPSVLCAQEDDQRFEPRPGGTGCEPGSVEVGIALPDSITTLPSLPGVIDLFPLLAPVFDVETLEIIDDSREGEVRVDIDEATIVYVAPLDFVGEDGFRYQVCRVADPSSCEIVEVEVEVTDGPAGGCTIIGTDGPDVLFGTFGDDVICGLGGNDLVFGLWGNDLILGGDGHDLLLGGPGFDRLVGGQAFDLCLTGFGGGRAARC